MAGNKPWLNRWLGCGGFSLAGTSVRNFAGSNGAATAISTWPTAGNPGKDATVRSYHQIAPNAAGNEYKILFLWGYGTNGTAGELAPAAGANLKVGIEVPNGTTPNTQDGARTAVMGGLARPFAVAGGGGAGGVVLSDTVHMPALGAKSDLFVNTNIALALTTDTIPLSGALSGGATSGTTGSAFGLGEGDVFGDTVDSGSVTNHVNRSPSFFPSAILCRTSSPKLGVCVAGDSRNQTGDGAGSKGVGCGGIFERVISNQPNVVYDYSRHPIGGYIKISIPGETADEFLAGHAMRMEAVRLSGCNIVAMNLGINGSMADSTTLATWKASAVTITKMFAALGVMTIWRTMPPVTDTTDGWLTTANQTARTGYSMRTAGNDWLRGTGGDSYIGACLAAGIPLNMVYVYDEAAPLEVNSSNVLIANGGFWLASGASSPASPADTMVLTSNGSGLTLTDNTKSWTIHAWKGYEAVARSGSLQYSNVDINNNSTAGVLSLTSNALASCASGDHIDIRNDLYTSDGLHPTGWGYCLGVAHFLGAGFPDRLRPAWTELTR